MAAHIDHLLITPEVSVKVSESLSEELIESASMGVNKRPLSPVKLPVVGEQSKVSVSEIKTAAKEYREAGKTVTGRLFADRFNVATRTGVQYL